MSLILRSIAVACLVATFWFLWGAPSERKLLLVALDGVRRSEIERLAGEGRLPFLASLVRSDRAVGITGGSRRNPRAYWRTALSLRDGSGTPVRLWEAAAALGIDALVVGVPGAEARDEPRLLIVPGAQETGGFIGDNVGRLVPAGAAQSGTLPWPYESAAPDVADAIRRSGTNDWSEWISLELPAPDGRRGFFRVHAVGADEVFVSPVYRRGAPARRYADGVADTLLYVPDDPSWTNAPGVSADLLYSHVRGLTEVRAHIAARLAMRPQGSILVYYDPLAALAEQASQPTRDPTNETGVGSLLASAYEEIDHRLAAILGGGGGRYDVILIGREPVGAEASTGDRKPGPVTTGFVAWSAEELRPLLAISDDRFALDGLGASVFALVASETESASTGAHAASRREPRAREAASRVLSSRSLRRLGLLRASSTAAPVRRESVTESWVR